MLIEDLKKILDSENIKENLEELIENLEGSDEEEEKEDTAEEKENDIKETVKDAIKELKKEEDISLSEVETEDRPILQLNFSDGEFSEEGTNKFRKQILKKGEWYHTNAAGGKLTIDDEMLDKIVENFNEGLIENVAVPVRHTEDPIKNTGEVIDINKTEDGLEAIVEVKDEKAANKITEGLIKGISASIDPNYVRKDTGESVGPVLRHAALVMEPFIKGLGEFVQLSDEEGREVVQLSESKEDNIYEVVKEFTKTVNELKDKIEEMNEGKEDEDKEEEVENEEEVEEEEVEESKNEDEKDEDEEVKESKDEEKESEDKEKEEVEEGKEEEDEEVKEVKESAKCRKEGETKQECVDRKVPELKDEGYDEDEAVAAAENMCSEACSEQSKEEQEEEVEVEEKKEEEQEEDNEEKEIKESAEEEEDKKEDAEEEVEVEEKKEEEEEGEDEEKEVKESAEEEEEQEDSQKEKENKTEEDIYRECMKEELNKGKSMVQSAKACKQKLDLEDKSEAQSDLKSKGAEDDQEANISLSDAKELYDEYLQKGRVTPSQKDDFIELAQDLGDRINLSDSNSKVGGLDKLRSFLDKQPQVIDFEEKGEGAKVDKETAEGDGDIPEEVKSLYSKMNLSEDQMKKAYRSAKKMKEDERKQDEKSIL